MKKSIWTGMAALCLLVGHAQGQVPSREARVQINVAERTLESVVDYLRDRSGANIEVMDTEAEEISTKVIKSLQLSDVHWRTALEIAAEKVGCIVEEREGGVLAVLSPPRITLQMTGEIGEVIDSIAKVSGMNIVVAPQVVGTVSVRFNGVPWRDALDVVAKTLGYTVVEENGGILRVVDPIVLQDQLVTFSYQLRYLRPRGNYAPQIRSEFVKGNAEPPKGDSPAEHFTVLRALEKALSPAGQMDYIERQNVVVIRDTQRVHEQVSDVLDRLDIEPMQVFCDVKFISTADTDLLNLGVDYGPDGPVVTASGGQIPITLPFDPGSGGFEDLIIANEGGDGPFVDPLNNMGATVIPDTIFGALSFTQVTATLRLLKSDTTSEVIQAPKIIALDGHEATIFVGETIRYAEAKSEQGQAGGLQLSLQEATSSPVEVGFQLLILPHVIPGSDRIMMEVIPKQTSLSGTGESSLAPPGFDVFTIGAAGLQGTIALPRTRSSTIVTSMMLDSGQTAVIGGLTQDQETETETRVPGLSRIPLIGELFKHRTKNRERRSLLVFLTPTIVHSRADHERLLQQELSRRRSALADEIEALVSGSAPGGEEPMVVAVPDEPTPEDEADAASEADPEPAAAAPDQDGEDDQDDAGGPEQD